MRKVRFMDLYAQYLGIKAEIDEAVASVIKDCAFVGGKYLEAFEKSFAAYTGTEHCVGVGNGTDALEAALFAMNLPKGSEVIIPANTFIATGEAVTNAGFKVVFADIESDYTVSPASIESLVNPDTSAVVPVHLYGQPCRMDEIMSIAAKHGLKVLEDCAQAHGAKYKGRTVGTFGDASAFSFYPGKNLGAYGDGGAALTNNADMAERMRQFSNHGRSSKFLHEFEGRNSRLDGMQAAILDVKLRHLDVWSEARRKNAALYIKHLAGAPVRLPEVRDEIEHVWHLFVIQAEKRDELRSFLKEKGIDSGIHYPKALPDLKAYEYVTQNTESFRACAESDKLLSLPMGEHLTEEDTAYVAEMIKQFYS
jgi:dTDP-4-amino-4,6-dideoxygalactose transaminase